MKMTGTKKLIIILLALACAIAAGLGVLFGGSSSERLNAAQTGSALAYEEANGLESPDGENTDEAASARDELAEEIEEAAEAAETEDQEAAAEEEYDDRYNETVIQLIAEAFNTDFATVNFYLRLKNLDANDILAQLEEDKLAAPDSAEYKVGVTSPDEEAGVENEEENLLNGDIIFRDMMAFGNAYRDGEITLDEGIEDEDWFVAPDDFSAYATRVNWANSQRVHITWWSKNCSYTVTGSGATDSWTNGAAYTTYTVPLAPGETFQINLRSTWNQWTGVGNGYTANSHWLSTLNYQDPLDNFSKDSVFVIDGDAPTGTVFYLVKHFGLGTSWNTYSYFFASNGTDGWGSCKYWQYRFYIQRSNPTKPTIVSEAGVSGNKKTVDFTGAQATISMKPDFGASLLSYTIDSNTVLVARSQHGKEGTGGTTIKFGSSVAGAHTITLTSSTGRWADNSTGGVSFTLELVRQYTTAPTIQKDANVAPDGMSKTVHDNGAYQTITFLNADKNFVGWSSNGMEQQSWSGTTLVLKAKLQGTYTINLYLLNSAGCSWSGRTGSAATATIQYHFYITEMYIKKPTMVEAPGSNELTRDYTGKAQSLSIKPAVQDQLLIVTTGVETTFSGSGTNATAKFSMTDAEKLTITIYPAEGYLWDDGTDTAVVFTFTIRPMYLTAPRLAAGEATETDGVTKRVTFDPVGGGATLTIENIKEDAISFYSALTKVSWSKTTDVLVVKGSDAITYPISFEIKSTNYEWASGVVPQTFYLQVDRYRLKAPYIVFDKDGPEADKIEGNTKTVQFADPAADKFFTLFTGGLDGQIQLTYSININVQYPLTHSWDTTGEPIITYRGTNAANYIINVTPTGNYCWDTGTLDEPNAEMVTFKFVINAIQVDNLTMYVPSSGGGFTTASTREGFADFDATSKTFRIGAESRETEWFDSDRMRYVFVDQNYREISDEDSELKCIKGKNVASIGTAARYYGILEFSTVHAGTYIVKLQLRNTDYAWRDGSGVDVYYKFTIKPKPIGTPTILEGECGGNQKKVFANKYLDGVYDGNNFTLVIGVKEPTYVNVKIDPFNNDNDPNLPGGKGIWLYPTEDNDAARIILQALNVGTHICRLSIKSEYSDFCWDDNVPYYEFQIRIDYAKVSGVTFYFESDGVEETLGGDGSFKQDAVFNEDLQNLIVRRSDENEFAETNFNVMFTYEINAVHVTTDANGNTLPTHGNAVYSKSQLSIGLFDADSYYIKIYLTSNYNWADRYITGTPYTCRVTVKPKEVYVPTILAGEDNRENDETIIDTGYNPTRRVIYNREYRTLIIDLGKDWKAYEVERASQGLTKDPTNYDNSLFVYRALDADTYDLTIKLSDDNNYHWTAGTTQTYSLFIDARPVQLPNAYLIDSDTVDGWIQTNVDKSITETDASTAIVSKPDHKLNEYDTPTVTYTKSAYRVYLFGEIVSKTRSGDTSLEAVIKMTAANAANANLITYGEVAQEGIKTGYYCAGTQVNEYSITIEFKLNQFGKSNYKWRDTNDTGVRTFTFEIEKMVVDVPTIDLSSNTDKDTTVTNPEVIDNTHKAYFVYGKKPYSIIVKDVLSAKLMTYINDNSLTNVGAYDETTKTVVFSTIRPANVGVDYKLTLRLDAANQRWASSTDSNDIADKEYCIVINKLGVVKPEILHDEAVSADVDYDATSKKVFYNGDIWIDKLIITQLDSDLMTYRMARPLSMTGVYLGAPDNSLNVSVTEANAGTYSVVISLGDPINTKWDGTTADSNDLNLSLVVQPKRIAKPQIDTGDSDGWHQDAPNDPLYSGNEIDPVTGDPKYYTIMTVTYNDIYNNGTHILSIKDYDYLDKFNLMQVKVISSYKFADSYWDNSSSRLIYKAKNVGEYTVRISLSPNAQWDDGTGQADIDIKLIISKYVHPTPVIFNDGSGDAIYSADGFKKTATYVLNTEQYIDVTNYDEHYMALWSTTPAAADKPFVNKGVQTGTTGYYRFGATHVGTYKVTFRLLDFTNNRWEFANTETVTFTFVINKLELKIPEIDTQYILDKDVVGAGNTSLTATYDAKLHSILVKNVLPTGYMEFKPVKNYNTSGKVNFTYDNVAIADSGIPQTDGTVQYPTVQSVLGYDSTRVFHDDLGGTLTYNSEVNKKDYITMKATNTGTYSIVFSLNESQLDDIIWVGGTTTDKTVTLSIKKMQQQAPSVLNGTTATSKTVKYTGKFIEFTIQNAFNGCNTAADWANYLSTGETKDFEYETHKVNSAISTVSGAKLEVVSWYGGRMVVRAREVGTYSVTISIKDTNTTEWTNTSAISRTLTFTITKAEVTPTISYSSNSSRWAISTPVTATITFNNICDRIAADGVTFEKLDLDLAVEFYYIKDYTTLKNKIEVVTPPANLTVTSTDPNWKIVKNSDGTYNLSYTYEIPHGTENISRGGYRIWVVQNGDNGNYKINQRNAAFTITADPAPFNENDIVWTYYSDGDPSAVTTVTPADVGLTNWKNASNSANPIELDYLEGHSYVFNASLNTAGMLGGDGAGYTDLSLALVSWEVKWDGVYTGDQRATYYKSTSYSVSFKITAKDADLYSFPDTVYTIYYKIKPVLYDLSGLTWEFDDGTQYDASNLYKYTFDDSAKTVKLVGTLPSGLTVSTYLVNGYDLNSQIYAGKYRTSLTFASSNANYALPVKGDPTTYKCNPANEFIWEVEWEIEKAKLDVEWEFNRADDGSYAYVPVLKSEGEKVDYAYYKKVGSGWEEVTTFEHTPDDVFRVYATLKSNSNNPATDYARNYELEFFKETDPTQNWYEFTLGAGDAVQVTVFLGSKFEDDGSGGTVCTDGKNLSPTNPDDNVFTYTGEQFLAEMTFIMSGGLSLSNVALTYYSSVNYNKPLTDAPVNTGSYKIKLTLVNLPDDGKNYELTNREFYFVIDKGAFDKNDIYWQYTHEDSDGKKITAVWDEDYSIWKITHFEDKTGAVDATKEGAGYIPTYDGHSHRVELISKDDRLTITNKNTDYINAGDCTTTVSFAYEGKMWHSPEENPGIAPKMDWKIAKAMIDLINIRWDYDNSYVYTIVAGKVTQYHVELDKTTFNSYLLDYISYETTKDGVKVANNVSNAGTYVTKCTIKDLPDNSNFELGEWPNAVPKEFEWEISQRKLEVPQSAEPTDAGYWGAFDGKQHDLRTAVTNQTGWEEYYSITMKYKAPDSTVTINYDGTKDYGFKYTAFNAGDYEYNYVINSTINTTAQTNVVWHVFDGTDYTDSTKNQTYTLKVDKAAMEVIGWNQNDELSKVLLQGTFDTYEHFVDYRFYRGDENGTIMSDVVSIDVILNSPGNEWFVIEPYINDAYASNIKLTYKDPRDSTYYFQSKELSQDPEKQRVIPKEVYIVGYNEGGIYHEFTADEWNVMLNGASQTPENKAAATVYVTYKGKPIEFVLNDWDTYYKNQLEIWDGNLEQNDVGEYSVTFILKQDNKDEPRCWSKTDNGDGTYTYDRSAVNLKFQLRYLMLTIPTLKNVTYTGAAFDNIIQTSLGDAEYDKLLIEYGNYVDITGASGTAAGTYRLYLTIKDEYVNSIRWNNNTAFGQPGMISIDWTILPIYIAEPILSGSSIQYNGEAHSVFEALKGYNKDGTMSADLQGLMQNAHIASEGSMAINAGSYAAVFSLPDSNYAWKKSNGTIDATTQSISKTWTIAKKSLDLSNAYWGYVDPDGKVVRVAYSGETKRIDIEYACVDGEPYEYTLKLMGIPADLDDFMMYGIGDDSGNTRSEVGIVYAMWASLFTNDLDRANYDVNTLNSTFKDTYRNPSGFSDLLVNWQIVPKKITVPTSKTLTFDGDVHDLLGLLGLADGWESYFNVSVEYRALDETDDEFRDYMEIAEKDERLGYSIYNVLYNGAYRVKLSIKDEMKGDNGYRIVWLNGGNTYTVDQNVIVTVNPLNVEVQGWNKLDERSTVKVKLPTGTSSAVLGMFDYVLREYNGEDAEPGDIIRPEDVVNNGNGYSYTIEFIVKPEYKYAVDNKDIVLDFEKNKVINPYIFGIYSFAYSTVVWVPIPELDAGISSKTFTNEELAFQIKDWDKYYAISDSFKATYPKYDCSLGAFIYATGENAGAFDTATGEIKVVKAGEYKITLRLNPNINLSWYDPAVYAVNASGQLYEITSGKVVTNTSAIESRFSKYLTVTVEKAKVRKPNIERLEGLLPALEYNGLTYNLKNLDQCKPFFDYLEREYGNLVVVTDGYTGSESGAHELTISLIDEESSYWDLNEKVTETVKEDGYELTYKRVNGVWKLMYVLENEDGTYTDYNGGNYSVEAVYKYEPIIEEYVSADGLLDSDGQLTDTDNVYATDSDGSVIRYNKLDDGTYEVSGDGEYLAKLKVDSNGEVMTKPSLDENFNRIIDHENSEVKVTYEKQSTEPYKVKWYIASAARPSPYLKTDAKLVFNGEAQSAADVLANFDPNIMEIVEDATGVDAGEYTAKIKFKDNNYVWADTEDDYIIVKWYIEKAHVDLSGISWSYTEETEFVFTMKDGKPIVHSVELINLPDAVKNSIRYTTNNTEGAHAGIYAGRYFTTFEIVNLDKNFADDFVFPAELQTSLTWYIQKRVLTLPELDGAWVVFDDEPHNLLEMLNLPKEWRDYFDIAITYSDGKSPFSAYGGYDLDGQNGIDDTEKYYAYGAGSYRYYFTIKTGINATGANVVWLKTPAV